MRKDAISWFHRLMPWIAKPTSDVRVLAWKKTVGTPMQRQFGVEAADTVYTVYSALIWCKFNYDSLMGPQWGLVTMFRLVRDSSLEWYPLVVADHIDHRSTQFFESPPTNADVYAHIDYRYNDFLEARYRYEGFIEGHVMEELWEETIGEKPERGFEGMSDDAVRRE